MNKLNESLYTKRYMKVNAILGSEVNAMVTFAVSHPHS